MSGKITIYWSFFGPTERTYLNVEGSLHCMMYRGDTLLNLMPGRRCSRPLWPTPWTDRWVSPVWRVVRHKRTASTCPDQSCYTHFWQMIKSAPLTMAELHTHLKSLMTQIWFIAALEMLVVSHQFLETLPNSKFCWFWRSSILFWGSWAPHWLSTNSNTACTVKMTSKNWTLPLFYHKSLFSVCPSTYRIINNVYSPACLQVCRVSRVHTGETTRSESLSWTQR